MVGVASPQAEAWQLIEAAIGSSRSELTGNQRNLDGEERRRLEAWLARRELREPLQFILGRAYFYGLEIPVGPGVLIPRPETERLVEIALGALHDYPEPAVLDLGTGSGAVALALKSERPDARVLATDLDGRALAIAERNAVSLGLHLEFQQSDLLADPRVSSFASAAKAIVSNPPYLPAGDRTIAPLELRWDPCDALYAGEDGLAVFRQLAAQAYSFLQAGSLLIVELDPRNVDRARAIAAGWSSAQVHEDLAGRRRFLELRR